MNNPDLANAFVYRVLLDGKGKPDIIEHFIAFDLIQASINITWSAKPNEKPRIVKVKSEYWELVSPTTNLAVGEISIIRLPVAHNTPTHF